jgi:hypothetical protein
MYCNMTQRALGLALATLAIGVTGCSAPQEFKATGKVTYNGKVLDKPNGTIVFIGPKGEQSVAEIGADGTYKALKVALGENKVVVYYPNPAITKRLKNKLKPGEEPPPTLSPYLTPEVYATEDTTHLKVTVDKDTVLDVDMKGPPIP